jgi:hypothetical protein
MRSVLNVCLHDYMIASVNIFGVYNGIVMPGAVHHKCYMFWRYLGPLFGTVARAASEAVDWITFSEPPCRLEPALHSGGTRKFSH